MKRLFLIFLIIYPFNGSSFANEAHPQLQVVTLSGQYAKPSQDSTLTRKESRKLDRKEKRELRKSNKKSRDYLALNLIGTFVGEILFEVLFEVLINGW